MKFVSETSASNQFISIHSEPFFKHGRFGKKTMKTFNCIFILIMVVHISMSSSYHQRDLKPQEDDIPHFQYKEHTRDRNPLRLRPRMWSCEKGKCVRRLMDPEDKSKVLSEYKSDSRLAFYVKLI